jgi:hypothetical protein
MGHIWLIYGLYMGYIRKQAIVAALQGVFKILVSLVVGNNNSLYGMQML